MPIYDKSVRLLMRDLVQDLGVGKGQIISRDQVLAWFNERYPRIKKGTIAAHLTLMSTNARSRVHYSARPDDDLFFQIDGSRFRLYDPATDPAPVYPIASGPGEPPTPPEPGDEGDAPVSEFAYESDLRDFLAKNLSSLESGLRLYQEEGLRGIEFPAGGRFIDILALDRDNNFVVIELKVSKGYDRVVGQLLRYIGWVGENLAEPIQRVRGMIVAREISTDLVLACSRIADIELYEYDLSVTVRKVSRQAQEHRKASH